MAYQCPYTALKWNGQECPLTLTLKLPSQLKTFYDNSYFDQNHYPALKRTMMTFWHVEAFKISLLPVRILTPRTVCHKV